MKKEEWKFIPGYEGRYIINNLGQVKSINYMHTGKEKIMIGSKDDWGYKQVCLSKDGKTKTYKIHHLVWDIFGDNPRNGITLQVDHIDNNKENNCIENLQLLNCRENTSKRSLQKEKTSKYTGVCFNKQSNNWKAYIRINSKAKHIGHFTSQEEANQAYINFKEKHNIK